MKKTILTLALFAFTLWSSAQTQEPALQVNKKVDCGSSFTLEATPTDSTLYHFVQWSDGNTDNPRTFSDVSEALTLTAIFAHNDLTISFTVDDAIGEVQNAAGEAISEIVIPFGEKKRVKVVVKDDCYSFIGWYKTGSETPYATTTELEIEGTEDFALEARFAKKQFEVKISLDTSSVGMGTILSKNE